MLKKVRLGELVRGDIFIRNKRAYQFSYKTDDGFIIVLELKHRSSYSMDSNDIVQTNKVLSYKHFKEKRNGKAI